LPRLPLPDTEALGYRSVEAVEPAADIISRRGARRDARGPRPSLQQQQCRIILIYAEYVLPVVYVFPSHQAKAFVVVTAEIVKGMETVKYGI